MFQHFNAVSSVVMLFTVDKEDEDDEEGPAEYEEVVEEEVDMVSAFANENMEEGTVPKVCLQHRCGGCNYDQLCVPAIPILYEIARFDQEWTLHYEGKFCWEQVL